MPRKTGGIATGRRNQGNQHPIACSPQNSSLIPVHRGARQADSASAGSARGRPLQFGVCICKSFINRVSATRTGVLVSPNAFSESCNDRSGLRNQISGARDEVSGSRNGISASRNECSGSRNCRWLGRNGRPALRSRCSARRNRCSVRRDECWLCRKIRLVGREPG